MDLFLIFVIILVGAFAGPVLALIALVRAPRAGARIRTLELELSRAHHEIRHLADRVGAIETSRSETPESGTTVEEPKVSPPAVKPPVVEPRAIPSEPKPAPATHATTALAVSAAPVTPEASTRSSGIEWERWLGIRGAAVLGALALGLAGLLFFQYSIEHGLISPALRVVLGSLAGIGCLVGASNLRKRGYAYTADGVAGAGVVILYAAFWAAHMRYGLIPMLLAFILMAVVTATCCVLATRHRSLLIAAAGLVGGFATPLLLSSGSDRPLGLFGYVLLLDCGLLLVARKGRWPMLGPLALAGTAVLETIWIGGRMGPDRLFLGMAILAVFGALFGLAGRFMSGDDDGRKGPWLWTRLGAVGLPFVFAIHFASRVDLGPHLFPLGIFLALLTAAAAFMARELKQNLVGAGAAGACVAVVGTWLHGHALSPALAWETVVVMAGLALLFHAFREIEQPEQAVSEGPTPAALLSSGGFFVLLVLASLAGTVPVWPLVAGWTALTALTYRHASFPGLGLLQPCAAVAWGIALTSVHLTSRSALVSPALFLTSLVLSAAGLFFVANLSRQDLRRSGMHAAAAFATIVLVGLPSGFMRVLDPWPALGVAALLGAVVAAAATWLRRGAWYAAAVGGTLIAQVGWMIVRPGLLQSPSLTTTAFFLSLITVLALTAWPFMSPRRFESEPAAWRAAALAGPLAFFPLLQLFDAVWGDAAMGLLPVVLGALALGGVGSVRRVLIPGNRASAVAEVWFAAVAACLFALAVPLRFDKEWITLGWALQGLALIGVWKRLDHPGLKYFGLALLGAATLRLVANPALLFYYPRSGTPILNWLLYTYLVPAGALLGSAALLRPLEVGRARQWERGLYEKGQASGAIASGFAAVAVVFVWINLAIADLFATGTRLVLDLGGDPAQRLTVSIAWAVYAVVLLLLGMARNSLGLRWLSLGFLMITIGKVFLYDLGTLQDLYRVGSLVGLAVSLILVSLLYQRFVFRGPATRQPT